jgi:hypothetical protein
MNLSLEEILSLLKIFHKSQFSTNITSPKNLFMNQFHIFQPRILLQVEIHKREAAELRLTVENLEKDNLEIMSELFECKIEDLKVSRFVE